MAFHTQLEIKLNEETRWVSPYNLFEHNYDWLTKVIQHKEEELYEDYQKT